MAGIDMPSNDLKRTTSEATRSLESISGFIVSVSFVAAGEPICQT